MKRTVMAISIVAMLSAFSPALNPLPAQDAANRAGVILGHHAAPREGYTTGAIPQADLNTIIQTGVRAPSAANRQPWFFTVVQNAELGKKIVPQMVQGNVIIVISTEGTTNREILDCGLATQSIYLAAQALGYGSRIYTGPVEEINKNLKGELGLPANRNAVAAVWVGRVRADAVSGASPRKTANETVTYK